MAARYPKHAAAVKASAADVGIHEQPAHSNEGERVGEMQSNTWLGGWKAGMPSPRPNGTRPATTNWPWCVAGFITWSLEAGFELVYRGAGAYAFLDWAKTAGWATMNVTRCKPGDGVVFNIGDGHIAQFLSYDKKTGLVHTRDANVADQVADRARQLKLVRGFVLLPEKRQPLPPAKPPVFEVATSEGGKVIYVSGATAIGRKISLLLTRHPGGVVIRRKQR